MTVITLSGPRSTGGGLPPFPNVFDGGTELAGPSTWTTDPTVLDPNGSGREIPILTVPAGVNVGWVSPVVLGPEPVAAGSWSVEVEAVVKNLSFPAAIINYQLHWGVTPDGAILGGAGCIVGSGNPQGLGAFGAWTVCGAVGRPFVSPLIAPLSTGGQLTLRPTPSEWRQAWYRTLIPRDGVSTVSVGMQYFFTGGAGVPHQIAFAVNRVTVVP